MIDSVRLYQMCWFSEMKTGVISMLGENHSIHHEFPDLHEKIDLLSGEDPVFREQILEHDKLDKQIRGLEMRESPVADAQMETMKHQRLQLKDHIYQRLMRTD